MMDKKTPTGITNCGQCAEDVRAALDIAELRGRIKTLESQLAAAREIVKADDELFAIYDGLPDPKSTDYDVAEYLTASIAFAKAMFPCREARTAAEQIDKETTDA